MLHEPKAMQEVLDIKEEAWKEVSHLPLDEAIKERLKTAEATARKLGFEVGKHPVKINKSS